MNTVSEINFRSAVDGRRKVGMQIYSVEFEFVDEENEEYDYVDVLGYFLTHQLAQQYIAQLIHDTEYEPGDLRITPIEVITDAGQLEQSVS